MSIKIDFTKGFETKVDWIGSNTVTIYSIKKIEPQSYCRKHQGVTKVDGIIYEWKEDCKCQTKS